MADKPKRFRLSLVNAAEDVPRLVRAYGRACDGEFALVLRPPEERGVLVLVKKKEGAWSWRSGEAPSDGQHRARARVERGDDGTLRLVVLDGPEAGVAFRPYEAGRGLFERVGQEVAVEYVPEDQFARVVAGGSKHGDAPRVPDRVLTAAEAVALVKAEQKGLGKPGPITLRGQWGGWLDCDGGAPRVELVRKLAAYGVLRIVSAPGEGWTWRVERTEKWFSKPGVDDGAAPTLLKAIEAGLARAMGLLGEACSVRDSRRRAALDSEYAVEHPVRPAKEGKDPIERFKPKEPRTPKVKPGSSWTHYAHDDEAPEADPIDKPSRTVLARVRAGGLRHDAGAGTFLGRTVEPFDAFPAGSLVFREPEDNAGFYLHAPVEEPKPRARKAKGTAAAPVKAPAAVPAGEVDAAKDKALLDAFSAAIAAAMAAT